MYMLLIFLRLIRLSRYFMQTDPQVYPPNVIELKFHSDGPARFSALLKRPIQPGNFAFPKGKGG